jgi:hypothetical protein
MDCSSDHSAVHFDQGGCARRMVNITNPWPLTAACLISQFISVRILQQLVAHPRKTLELSL